ncbi:MAG: hypothetical protein Kow00127_21660 [Bacteroidales bacterium]
MIFRLLPLFIVLVCTLPVCSQDRSDPEPYGYGKSVRYFIQQEMRYPEELLGQKIKGTVTLKLEISAEGKITRIEALNEVHPLLLQEAERLAGLLCWYPAKRMGKTVPGTAYLKINFDPKSWKKRHREEPDVKAGEFQLPPDPEDVIYGYKKVNKPPRPLLPEGSTLNEWLNNHLVYPEEAKKRGVSGTVEIRFVVEKSGVASNIEILKSVGGGCTAEAVRVVQEIKWIPAIKNNRRVRCRIPFRLTFGLSGSASGVIPTPGQVY